MGSRPARTVQRRPAGDVPRERHLCSDQEVTAQARRASVWIGGGLVLVEERV